MLKRMTLISSVMAGFCLFLGGVQAKPDQGALSALNSRAMRGFLPVS